MTKGKMLNYKIMKNGPEKSKILDIVIGCNFIHICLQTYWTILILLQIRIFIPKPKCSEYNIKRLDFHGAAYIKTAKKNSKQAFNSLVFQPSIRRKI